MVACAAQAPARGYFWLSFADNGKGMQLDDLEWVRAALRGCAEC